MHQASMKDYTSIEFNLGDNLAKVCYKLRLHIMFALHKLNLKTNHLDVQLTSAP